MTTLVMPDATLERSSFSSALLVESPLRHQTDASRWLDSIRENQSVAVHRVDLTDLQSWKLSGPTLRLVHESGRFFALEGIRTSTDYGPVACWDQPIINQPEHGILGILTRMIGGVRYYLMQAKVEPGNVNGAQLSPTLQATLSNYRRVHKGQVPKYLEYFNGERPVRVLVEQLQSEQASRFLYKRNRNIIVETTEDVCVDEGFRWLTLGEIKQLLRGDNLVNMCARSVIACIGIPEEGDALQDRGLSAFGCSLVESASRAMRGLHDLSFVVNWLARLRATYESQLIPRGLDELDEWALSSAELRHRDGRYFAVIGADICISGREVARWMQPLLHHRNHGLNGMVTQKLDGVLHFLVRACFYPGNRDRFELGPTISRSDYQSSFDRSDAPPYLDLFRDPPPAIVRYSRVQSEEGGRFLHYQNRYVILELPPRTLGAALPLGFVWLTLRQIQKLLPHGYFSIEARNLLACLPLS